MLYLSLILQVVAVYETASFTSVTVQIYVQLHTARHMHRILWERGVEVEGQSGALKHF